MTTSRDLANLLRSLLAAGTLRYRCRYARSDLLLVFRRAMTEAEAEWMFAEVRGLVANEKVGEGLYVHTVGVRRGMKYIFTESPITRKHEEQRPATRSPLKISAESATTPVRAPVRDGVVRVLVGDNLPHLRAMETSRFRLIYIDPPFNTGKRQARTRISTVRDDTHGDRTGFKGQRYRTIVHGTKAFGDIFDDYLGFLAPRLVEAHRLLAADGSLFLHLDYREVHYAKVLLDEIFGRESFINEIVWAYDYGARSTKKWSAKHDNILWYAKDPERYVFNFEEMDRIPYMAPGLVGPEKAARGKTPTDVWWHTIVSPNGREKTGYPTQKPLGVLQRIVKVHSEEGDELLDFFAGSGTLGEAGASLGRSVTLIDDNEEALSVMGTRLARFISRDGPASPRERETRDRDYDDGAVGTDAGELAAKSAIAPTLTADMPSPRPDPKNQGDLFA